MPDELYGANIWFFCLFFTFLNQVPSYMSCFGKCCSAVLLWCPGLWNFNRVHFKVTFSLKQPQKCQLEWKSISTKAQHSTLKKKSSFNEYQNIYSNPLDLFVFFSFYKNATLLMHTSLQIIQIITWEIHENIDCAVFHIIKESAKKILDPALYRELIKGSIMGQDSSSIQVSWKKCLKVFV